MTKVKIKGIDIELTEEQEKELLEKYKTKVWFPEEKEYYHYVDLEGYVCEKHDKDLFYRDADFDFLFKMGNIFKTEEEAEKALRTGWIARRRAEVKIKRFIIENGLDFTPDWSNQTKKVYEIYFHNVYEKFVIGDTVKKHSALPYFETVEDAKKVLNKFERELEILFDVRYGKSGWFS